MRILFLLAGLATASCGGPAAPPPHTDPTPQTVTSTDFALLPCARATTPNPCVLVMAGGKRVLFGTPAGARISKASMTYAMPAGGQGMKRRSACPARRAQARSSQPSTGRTKCRTRSPLSNSLRQADSTPLSCDPCPVNMTRKPVFSIRETLLSRISSMTRIAPCGMTQASQFAEKSRLVVGCPGAGLSWPITEIAFIDQDTPEKATKAP